MTDERKITLVDEDQAIELYVLEETRLNGFNYLLVTDSDNDEEDADCYILKDRSKSKDAEALYEFVEDETELDAVMNLFEALLEDVDIEKQ